MENKIMKNEANFQNDEKLVTLADNIVQIVTEARGITSKYIHCTCNDILEHRTAYCGI